MGIDPYPHLTIAEFGKVSGVHNMKSEIYRRGPITAELNADPMDNY